MRVTGFTILQRPKLPLSKIDVDTGNRWLTGTLLGAVAGLAAGEIWAAGAGSRAGVTIAGTDDPVLVGALVGIPLGAGLGAFFGRNSVVWTPVYASSRSCRLPGLRPSAADSINSARHLRIVLPGDRKVRIKRDTGTRWQASAEHLELRGAPFPTGETAEISRVEVRTSSRWVHGAVIGGMIALLGGQLWASTLESDSSGGDLFSISPRKFGSIVAFVFGVPAGALLGALVGSHWDAWTPVYETPGPRTESTRRARGWVPPRGDGGSPEG
jgi:hypothetical protein